MAADISPSTKVPLGWMVTMIVGMAGAVLFLADIRSQANLNSATIQILEKRVEILEQDLKTELRLINSQLQKINTKKDLEK